MVTGNPNVGKTTLINVLAGTQLKVGNWAGVTVEKREAALQHKGRPLLLLDLPGAYSLSPHTPEELITRTALLDEAPEAIIDVIDAGNLERNLYLTLSLLDLGLPVSTVLNLVDEARDKGIKVDAAALSRNLGVPVVETVASRGQGTGEVLDAVLSASRPGLAVRYPAPIEAAVDELSREMERLGTLPPHAHRYVALSLLEGDPSLRSRLTATGHTELIDRADTFIAELEAQGLDPLIDISEARYARARYCAAGDPGLQGAAHLQRALRRPDAEPLAELAGIFCAAAGLPPYLYCSGPLGGFDWRAAFRSGERLGCRAAGRGAAAVRPGGGGHPAGGGHGLKFPAYAAGAVPGDGFSGRQRLHGPRGFSDGPADALGGAGRPRLYSADSGLWVQCACDLGHPHAGTPQ